MSSIERLLIQGIRSFGPEDKDKAEIKFSTPLTLILGQNGCGKTTIIEALKYATCGELPTNSDSGSGFIHDPKLCDLINVKGHVKLRFNDVKGKNVTVARTALVTQKAKKLEFKTLDATVTNFRKESISGRCADIDSYMCNKLGVSKAILTNVIFCHQEDSEWPLEKGKKIKEKFDAIFGITEYNKCLDHMRHLAKNMDAERNLAKKDVDFNKAIWDETQEKKTKLGNTKATLSASVDEITSVDNQLEPFKRQFDEILHKEMNLVEHFSKITRAKNKKELFHENLKELKKQIKVEFLGSVDELKRKISNFEDDLRNEKAKLQKLQEDKDFVIKEESRHQKNISAKQMHLGTLQSEEDSNNRKMSERNLSMNKLADELKIPILSSCDINQNSAADMLESIEQKIKESTRALEKEQENFDQEEKKVQHEIDTIREKKVGMEHEIKMKIRAIDENKSETARIKKRIEDVDKSAETLALLEKDLVKVNKELEDVMKSLDVDECKTRINDNISKRNNLESKLSKLSEEIKILQKFSIEKANLDKLHERKRELEGNFKSLIDKNSGSLKHLIGDIPEKDFHKGVQSCMNKLTVEIRSKEKAISDKEKELTVLTEKKRNLDATILSKKQKLADDEDLIVECCGDEDFNAYLKNLKEKIDNAQNCKGTLNASEFMFKRYVTKLESDNPLCPLCRRDFSSQEEISVVVNDLTKRLGELPNKLTQTSKELETLQKSQSTAMQLVPVYENIARVRDEELPKLRKDVSEMKQKLETLENEIKNLRDELAEPSADQGIAEKLFADAIALDHMNQELRKLQVEIKTQQKKIPEAGSNKTLQQAHYEEDDLKSQLNACRKELENSQTALSNYNEKLNKLRERKNVITNEQMKTKGNVQQRKELSEKLDELEMTTVLYENELSNLKKDLNPTTDQMNKLTQDLRDMKINHKMKINESRKKLNEFDKKCSIVRNLHLDIEKYNKEGGSNRLDKIRQELKELQSSKEENTREKERIEKQIQNITQLLHTGEMNKMDFENNLQYRQKQEDVSKLEQEITELEGLAGALNLDNLKTQKIELKGKIDRLEKQRTLIEGRQFELRSSIKEMEFELNKDKHKNAEQNYRQSIISLKVLSMALDDLKQYEKAMDWAMIYFHKERMKMINTIVRDLWRQIYRGNDIDSIEIRTDETQTSSGCRRNYNYRVVQIKNGIELDMPGRCSAGQKVLACLIIRMALAETFSKNCGIMALDEPTTNLDRQNIESLSIALGDIVNRRMVQKNFQLLVITHDEDFLNTLTRGDRVEYYLKVKRNDRGKSEVERVNV